ncbi:MAG: DUF881 domain-containing protein [Propionicimonas sp.]|uniref:DUF881 domain-containing protein n=1 Tax=Propionicimonas sp. TaxID=1955623 RepID=UPI002B20FEED|nr:DUF881 domain-containing protein [Propionicimonas sp.]MEA4945646.1 DUF881 domain-containing protein [Propionicimonas sp.]
MTSPPSTRRVDASMDLLNNIIAAPIDPDYAAVAAQGRPVAAPRRSVVVGVVLVLFGLLVGASVAPGLRAPLQAQQERDELLQRVQAADSAVDRLRGEVAGLTAANRELTESIAGQDVDTSALVELETVSGAIPVTGPGIRVTVDDGSGDDRQARVVDADLRQLVNQLWSSGAEAIAINGHRLSGRTAIRGAGDAITVDYRSLTRPYQVEAIGDADAMIREFPTSSGGQWWAWLQQNYGVGFTLSRAETLRLPADPELTIDRAEPAR